MFRVVALFVFVNVILAAGDEELMHKCSRLNPNLLRCCKSIPKKSETTIKPEVVECLHKYTAFTCDADECIAKKLGFYGSDGKLDMEAFTNYIEKEFEQNPEILGIIKENCVNADIMNKGIPELCDFAKMNICILRQFIRNCSEWSNEGPCSENKIKEINDMCVANEN